MQVRVANMTFDLGYLEYEQSSGGLSLIYIIIIVVIVGTLCLVVAIVVFAVICHVVRSKRRVAREYRRALKQLTDLETSVREQCKQGEEVKDRREMLTSRFFKRQVLASNALLHYLLPERRDNDTIRSPVSYTHLTLPTILRV